VQLDALTAGAALILVQLCMALAMAGTFYAAPSEKCTRYWAASGVFIAFGVLLVVLNAGAPRYLVLLVGNNSLIIGLILQWRGIRAFYRRPGGYAGLIVGAAFFLLFGLLLLHGAPATDRALLSSSAILAMLILCFHEIWTGQRKRRSFASLLALSAVGLLICSYSFRLGAMLFKYAELLPNTQSLLSVVVLYLVPVVGTILFWSGLLLLYFNRILEDKHFLATHDELTGVLNRRAIVAGREREVALATRMRQPVAVAYLDIDHFKRINDELGHEAGDKVITEVAQVLKQACRSIDLVGRYGGEEFCIVFPGVDRDNMTDVGKRLIDTVRQHRFRGDLTVTVSVGLAALSRDDSDRSWADLIRRADNELYKAKGAGRNQHSVEA
jgi:diguanylate cyclase (GGDEF)-like protein